MGGEDRTRKPCKRCLLNGCQTKLGTMSSVFKLSEAFGLCQMIRVRTGMRSTSQGRAEKKTTREGGGACCSDDFQPGVNSPRSSTFSLSATVDVSASTTSLSGF